MNTMLCHLSNIILMVSRAKGACRVVSLSNHGSRPSTHGFAVAQDEGEEARGPNIILMVSRAKGACRTTAAVLRLTASPWLRMRERRLAVQHYPHGEPMRSIVSNHGNRPSTNNAFRVVAQDEGEG